MTDTDFFSDYLMRRGITKALLRAKIARLMALLVAESFSRKEAVDHLRLMELAGMNRNQFYYAVDGGVSGVWSHVFHAALLFTRQLTGEQRELIIGAANTLDFIRGMTFPDALNMSIQKDYPIRQPGWTCGYVTNNGTQFFICDELHANVHPWTPSHAQMFARDWEIALPDRFTKDS